MGVHSVLSLPLLLPDRVIGAMNVYAHAKDAFTDDSRRIGELFAVPVAVSVHDAQVLAQSQRLAEHLAEALTSRAVVEQARGILMSRTGGSAEQALDRLRVLSQDQQVKVLVVAQKIVDDAQRQARARATDS